ncbi:MAG: hypothetical protein U1A77_06675 [Pirellulales bacterium]
MMSTRQWAYTALALFALVFSLLHHTSLQAADLGSVSRAKIPGTLITTQTKQVYRFHFSGLQGADAVRLAAQLWPVVATLPVENPLRQTLADAKDRDGFIDDYRSLRASFLAAGVDTIYFLADAYWIESSTLPGRVAMVGDEASRDRLQRRLQAAGHEVWATTVARLQPVPQTPGWLVASIGAPVNAPPSLERYEMVDHALSQSCPLQPATAQLGSLPVLHMTLNHATPLTVVNLERSTLDEVLTKILADLVPSSTQAAPLIRKARASTMAASIYPMTHVRLVTHLKTPAEAAKLAVELQAQVNGAAQRIVDLDEDLGPLLGWFAKSMALVSAQGSDVHLVMKPPALFDLALAQSKMLESQDLDWTALPAPEGYHWEVAGALGVADRRDVFARVRAARVRGGLATVAPEDPSTPLARFRIPLPDSELVLFRNLKGQLKVDVAGGKRKPTSLPALDLLDERGRLAAVLRLDLQQGDPRFDLARTRAVLAQRIKEREDAERKTKKTVDAVENEIQRGDLDGSLRMNQDAFNEAQSKRSGAYRDHRYEEAARVVFQELDGEAREAQRKNPSATLVKNGDDTTTAPAAWAVDRRKYPFAGQWLFDHGVLTLYQDARGAVAGVFATKVFHYTADMTIDQTKPTTGSAILVGQAQGSELPFTMYDHRGRERKGKLTLNPDGTGGNWSLMATEGESLNPLPANEPTKPSPGISPKKGEKGRGVKSGKPKGNPKNTPPVSPFGPPLPNPLPLPPPMLNPLQGNSAGKGGVSPQLPTAGFPLGLPPVRRAPRNAEPARNGLLDRIETASPDRLCQQQTSTASFAGYWVHPTNKLFNILFEREPSGLLNGKQGSLPVPKGNLRGAAVGNLLLILENVNMELVTPPSVVGAQLSDDGERLVYLAPHPRGPSTNAVNRSDRLLELTRDHSAN